MFGMFIIFFCEGIVFYLFVRNYLLYEYSIENSICCKNVISLLWKEFFLLEFFRNWSLKRRERNGEGSNLS